MSDEQQVETGADVNALRGNFQPGESKDLNVLNVRHGAEAGAKDFIVKAEIETDRDGGDTDNVTLAEGTPEGWEPTVGEVARFTRTEDGKLVVGPVTPDEGAAA